MAAVTGHYKDSRVIGGWIVGNEYAYFDLWEDPRIYPTHRFIGFDGYSQASYRDYLTTIYGGDISALNARWGTTYPGFDAVLMPLRYPDDRVNPGYHDLIQWRRKSIGDFVALGAAAARNADPNHLKSYSMVGGIYSGRDASQTCEDARTIVAQCAQPGAARFWSLNNYANAAIEVNCVPPTGIGNAGGSGLP
jgi:beta-galactosidase GanA